MQGWGFAVVAAAKQAEWAILKRTNCRPVGHEPLEQYVLSESGGVEYPFAERNAAGKALSWPTCPRCGYQKVDVEAIRRRRHG